MTRFLFKSGPKNVYIALLGICLFLVLWQKSQQEVDTRYEKFAIEFFEKHSEMPYDEWEKMLEESIDRYSLIQEWHGYEKEIQIDELAEAISYMPVPKVTMDMVRFREEALSAPGRWTETVREDLAFTTALKTAMFNQYMWKETADNRLQLLERNIRRYQGDSFRRQAFINMTANYKEIYADLEESCKEQKVFVYPDGVGRFLTQLQKDFGHLVILLLVSFPVFVNFLKDGIGAQGFVSQMGIKISIRRQYVSHMMWSFLLYWGYMILFLLSWREQVVQGVWLEKPMQIISGYEYFPYSITVAGFILLLMTLKCIMAMAVVALILGISFVSKNNIVSMAAGGLLVVGMMAAGTLEWPVEVFNGLPYFPLVTYPVPKSMVLVLVSLIIVILVGILLPVFGKKRILSIYSGR